MSSGLPKVAQNQLGAKKAELRQIRMHASRLAYEQGSDGLGSLRVKKYLLPPTIQPPCKHYRTNVGTYLAIRGGRRVAHVREIGISWLRHRVVACLSHLLRPNPGFGAQGSKLLFFRVGGASGFKG